MIRLHALAFIADAKIILEFLEAIAGRGNRLRRSSLQANSGIRLNLYLDCRYRLFFSIATLEIDAFGYDSLFIYSSR